MPYITVEQKLLLRQWYEKQQPKPSQKQAASWFKENYGIDLPQPQISRILHSKRLNQVTFDSPGLKHSRVRSAEWPAVETILHRWQVGMKARGITASREALTEKARYIWTLHPEARNGILSPENAPVFGPTWCTLFQRRYHLEDDVIDKESVARGPEQPEPKSKIDHIKQLVVDTPAGNRYSMSQTGLYWRRTASSAQGSGKRSDKTRVTVAVTVNDTGEDRFKAWVVGDVAVPRALRNFNFSGHGLVWKHNSTASFTTGLIQEWLTNFYAHILRTKPGQNVLLLLDHSPLYVSAVRLTPAPSNITVDFFPSNVASTVRPCHLGIIATLKSYYRRSFLLFIATILERELDLDIKLVMNLRLALVWLSEHYFTTLRAETIANCWKKSGLLGKQKPSGPCEQVPEDLPAIYTRATAHIPDCIPFPDFMKPKDENRPPNEPTTAQEVFDQVVEDYFKKADYRDPKEVEEENRQPEPSTISPQEGITAILKLLRLAEVNDAFNQTDILSLQHMLNSLKAFAQQPA